MARVRTSSAGSRRSLDSGALPDHPPHLRDGRVAFSAPSPGSTIRRMSSELEAMDHEAQSYLEQEREQFKKPTAFEKLKKMWEEAEFIRLPRLPILEWLPKYQVKQQLTSDLNAGLACAVLLIPQGLAYGIQIGVPVIHGLYGAIFFGLVYAVMGTSRETCPANIALVTMMAASALDQGLPEGYTKPMRLAAALKFTFLTGVFQIGLGVFRLGAIVHYVSYPVMVACNSAGIIITIISQLKYFLGIKVPSVQYTYQVLEHLFTHLGQTNGWEILIGGVGFLFIYGVTIWRKTKPKGTRLDKSVADSINVPNATPHAYTTTPSYKYAHSALRNAANLSPILMMVLSTVGAWALVKHRGTDIRIIKDLPSGFQTFDAWKLGMEDLSTYATSAMTVAVVSFLLSYNAEKRYANQGRYEINVDQELSALGFCNLIGSCFGGFAAVTGFARASVNYEAGGRTQVSAICASVAIIVCVQWLAPLFYYVPMASLAALLCGSLISALDLKPYGEAYRCSKRDFFVLISTALIMLGVGIDKGIYCGIAISIINLLLKYSYPDLKPLGRLPGSLQWRTLDRYPHAEQLRHIRVVRLDEALTFVNGDFVKDQLLKEARRMEHEAAMAGKGGERGSIHKGEGRFGSFHNLFSLTLKALTPASSSNTLAVAPAAGESGSGGTKGKHKKASSEDSDDGEHAHHGGRTPVSNASSSDHTASTVGTAMQTPATAPPPQPATPATITATATAPDPHCPYSSSSSSSKKRCRLFIVLDASGVNFTDLSGMRALADVNQDLREHGVRLLIARAKHRLRDKLRLDPALFRDLGGEMMYLSLEELVLLLERHDMRLHGTPFPSCTDLRALGGNTSAVLPPGAIMGVVCASSEASSQAATPPNGTMSPTVVDAAAAEAAATAGPTPVPAPAALAALAASVSGSWRAMGKQASSSPSGGLAPMVNVVVQEPVIGESGEKDKEDDYAVGVEPGGVVNGAGSSQVNSSAASDAEEDAAIGGSHGRIV